MIDILVFLVGVIVGCFVTKRFLSASVVATAEADAVKVEKAVEADAKAAVAAVEADAKKL